MSAGQQDMPSTKDDIAIEYYGVHYQGLYKMRQAIVDSIYKHEKALKMIEIGGD